MSNQYIFQTIVVPNDVGGTDRKASDGRCQHACVSRDGNGIILRDDSCELYEVMGTTEICMGDACND